jgi:hypothetical protein
MTAQTAADLRAAADVIRRDGWTQETYVGGGGCRCLVGAIVAALGGNYGEGSIPLDNQARARKARTAFAKHFGHMDDRWWGDLIDWNDDPDRTADEVIAALEAAAAAEEAAP